MCPHAFISGCPVQGFFGSNCSDSCPDVNCRFCQIETGVCQGCGPGFQGHRCELGTFIFLKIPIFCNCHKIIFGFALTYILLTFDIKKVLRIS